MSGTYWNISRGSKRRTRVGTRPRTSISARGRNIRADSARDGCRAGPFGVVLLAPRDAEPRALAGSAVAVWEALAEPVSRDDLVADLAAAFRADPATVAADVPPLLEIGRAHV